MMVDFGLFTHRVNLSKSVIPHAPTGHFERERLIKRLDKASYQKYVLIQAPLGYGKSTLLSYWYYKVVSNDSRRRVVWFAVDAADSDADCFWSNFLASLSQQWPGLHEAIEKSRQLFEQSHVHEVIIEIANHIAQVSDIDAEYYLVMTNFERFKFSESEMQFFTFTNMLPSNIHVIMSSRVFLSNHLIQQDFYSGLSLIGVKELSFREDELKEYISKHIGVELSTSNLELLYAKTEGWPLAAEVLVQAVTAGTGIEQAIDELTGNNRFLSEFVFEKTFSVLPERITTFLIETAFLKRLCASLCNYVTEGQESQDIIRYLDRNGIFTTSIDMEHVWFRYHPLFADWLQHMALKLRNEQLRKLNSRTAQWYRDNNKPFFATKFVIASTDDIFVSRLAQYVFGDLPSEYDRLLLWLFSLDESQLEDEPRFCLLAAWAYAFLGRPNDARYWNDKAMVCQGRDDRAPGEACTANGASGANGANGARGANGANEELSQPGDLRAQDGERGRESVAGRLGLIVKIIEAKCLTLRGRARMGIELCQGLLRANDPHMDEMARMVLLQSLGEAHEQLGDLNQAMHDYSRALTIARANQLSFLTAFTRYQIASLLFEQGHMEKTEVLCRTAIRECPPDYTVYGALYSLLAQVKLEQNHLDELDVIIKRAVSRVSADRNIDIFLDACVARSGYLSAKRLHYDSQVQMAVAIDAIRRSKDIPPRGVAYRVFVQQARNYLAQGEVATARETIAEFDALGFPRSAMCSLVVDLMRLRIDLASSHDLCDSLTVIEELSHRAASMDCCRIYVGIDVVRAIVCHQIGDRQASLASLNEAVMFARREQMIRVFLEEGDVVRMLLAELAASPLLDRACEQFVCDLVKAFAGRRRTSERVGGQAPSSQLSKSRMQAMKNLSAINRWNLTAREQEVLTLLQEGYNRKDIASRFCTSQNTVKTHISHIYEKLGVHSVPELLGTLMEHDLL
ncbi:MAG: LuxR C-terminal-related transcriptional regulator [Coriobacteriales bacterium]|jgi:LuxR family maltose regulon positive regulatory protein|nr:LuxR C-terminal-related transcriptional regulator [Coriobacteriales bacterium]